MLSNEQLSKLRHHCHSKAEIYQSSDEFRKTGYLLIDISLADTAKQALSSPLRFMSILFLVLADLLQIAFNGLVIFRVKKAAETATDMIRKLVQNIGAAEIVILGALTIFFGASFFISIKIIFFILFYIAIPLAVLYLVHCMTHRISYRIEHKKITVLHHYFLFIESQESLYFSGTVSATSFCDVGGFRVTASPTTEGGELELTLLFESESSASDVADAIHTVLTTQ